MRVIKATKKDKRQVLRLLDEFRTACMEIIDPNKKFVSTSATKTGGGLFDKVIKSPDSALFLAVDNNNFIGIVTVHKIPQIRKGCFCAEIEEMFVEKNYQGKGVAQLLIKAVIKWAEKENVHTVRLESSNELRRAHGFYEKSGFKHYGRAYEKRI